MVPTLPQRAMSELPSVAPSQNLLEPSSVHVKRRAMRASPVDRK